MMFTLIFNIYTLLIIVTLLMMIVYYILPRKEKKKFIIINVVLWGSVMAFRSSTVGTDTFNYCRIFDRIAQMPIDKMCEYDQFAKFPLYVVYNKIVSLISCNSNIIIFFNSAIFMSGIAIFLFYNSEDVAISFLFFLCFYFYFAAMNISRQSISIMLVMWVYHFAKQKKIFVASIVLLSAVLVHNAAILGIVVLFFELIELDRKKTGIILVGVALTMRFANIGVSIFTQIFASYNNYSFIFQGSSDGNRVYIAIPWVLLYIVVFVWAPKVSMRKDEANKFWHLILYSAIGLEFMIILSSSATFWRIELYFTYFLMVSIPYIFQKFFGKQTKRFMYILSIIMMLIPFYYRLDTVLPYETYLFM